MFLQCFKGDRGKLLRSNNNAPAPPSQNLFPILATLFNSRALGCRWFRGGRGGLVGGGDISNGIDQAFHSKHVARESKSHVQVCRFTLKKTCLNPHLEEIIMSEWKQG